MHVDRHQCDLEWGDRVGPDNAIVVIVLFDSGSDNATDTNTVTAHAHKLLFSIFIEHGSFHRFTVLGAELEDMTNFNASFNF